MTMERSSTAELRCETSGSPGDPAVLFVHGAGANHRQFAREIEEFGADFHTLAVSLRGHDGSERAADPGSAEYTPAALAGDVLALLDERGVGRFHMVGNSLGGLIGFEIIRQEPGRLCSLTVFGTAGKLRFPRWLLAALRTAVRIMGPRGIAWVAQRGASREPETSQLVGEMFRSADPNALGHLTTIVGDYDYTGVLRGSDTPVMIVRGGRDRGINRHLESTIKALGRRALVVDLPDAGHFANLDRPEEFAAIVRNFIEQVEGDRI